MGGVEWWRMCFGWWSVVVDILWMVVVGGGVYILAGGGWWGMVVDIFWLVVGDGIVKSDPFRIIMSRDYLQMRNKILMLI